MINDDARPVCRECGRVLRRDNKVGYCVQHRGLLTVTKRLTPDARPRKAGDLGVAISAPKRGKVAHVACTPPYVEPPAPAVCPNTPTGQHINYVGSGSRRCQACGAVVRAAFNIWSVR